MIPKALVIWLVIAAAETLHGILRVKFINPRTGDKRARQFAVITGSLLILAICWIAIPWVAPRSTADSLVVGGIWFGLMLAFDLALGRLWLRLPWSRLLADFNPWKGGFLGMGMLVLFLAPLVMAGARYLY